jgi:hypothetical protein
MDDILIGRVIKTFFSGKFFWSRAVAGYENSISESAVKCYNSVLLSLAKSNKGFKGLSEKVP